MQPVMIQKAFNNTFYYVETEQAQASAAIYQFKCEFIDGGINVNSKKIHEVSNGKVLALELDADHMLKNQDRAIYSVGFY